MDIGEVIQRSGLPASTLRFYEDKKLIEPVGRNGLRRNYDADVLDRLASLEPDRLTPIEALMALVDLKQRAGG